MDHGYDQTDHRHPDPLLSTDAVSDLAGALAKLDDAEGDAHVGPAEVQRLRRDVIDCARVVVDAITPGDVIEALAKLERCLIAAETRDPDHLDDLAAANADPQSRRLHEIIERRRAELRVLLDSFDRTEVVEAQPPYPGWAEAEHRREAAGLAVQMVNSGHLAPVDLLHYMLLMRTWLAGDVELVSNEVPDELLEQAAQALGGYAQAKATSQVGGAAAVILAGESVAQALQAILDALPEAS